MATIDELHAQSVAVDIGGLKQALIKALRAGAEFVSPPADGPGAAAVAGIRSLLPGRGNFSQEFDRYNRAAAPSPLYSGPEKFGSVVKAPGQVGQSEGEKAQAQAMAMQTALIAALKNPEATKKFFGASDKMKVPEGIAAAEDNYHGGVANLGDRGSAELAQQMKGYFDYRGELEDAARSHLGDKFEVFRNMSEDAFKAWKNGEPVGPVSFTLDREVAEAWGKLPGVKGPRKIVSTEAEPGQIRLRGRPEEAELVLDGDAISFNTLKDLSSPEAAAAKVLRLERRQFSPKDTVRADAVKQSDPGYLYHATNVERANDIAQSRMKLHEPWEFTDQGAWPDGSVKPRAYFSPRAQSVASFAPEEGPSVVLRTPEGNRFRPESGTGDVVTHKPISARNLEIATPTGWEALVKVLRGGK